jgi:hypothetical protein
MRAQEFVIESIDADQVLDYVKRTHAPEEFDIEYSITDHPKWELKIIPLSQLNLDPDGEAQDPYNRVNWVDDDKVQELIPRIGSVLKSNPIVVDPEGWIIDGNHRAMAAVEAGMDSVPAYVPVKQGVTEGEQPGKSVTDAIQKVLPIAQEIWFHGSRATGKHRRNSDTDILVVVPDDLVGDQYLAVVRTLQKLSSIFDNYDIQPTKSGTNIHRIAQEEGQLLWSNKQDMAENFADGRVKGKSRPGRVKRSGASCDGSVTDLRAKARKYGGEKGRMYHWCANMKSGKK